MRRGRRLACSRVHPRASGGAGVASARRRSHAGSIPARAGEPRQAPHWRELHTGSIPARAGEPRSAASARAGYEGPSPRERGSRRPRAPLIADVGVHPRASGGAARIDARHAVQRVHPRASGGARVELAAADRRQRVHPRASGGAAARASRDRCGSGSIPARAGEPARTQIVDASTQGPSPRERGSLAGQADSADVAGSIPARAGEPRAEPAAAAIVTGPSPRERGSRDATLRADRCRSGPSPRERGSLCAIER